MPETKSTLIVFGGLPGTGKTTLARAVAEEHSATYLRIGRAHRRTEEHEEDKARRRFIASRFASLFESRGRWHRMIYIRMDAACFQYSEDLCHQTACSLFSFGVL